MSLPHITSATPRRRLRVSLRELLLSAAILAIGGYLTVNWLRHPDAHTLVRWLGTGVAAIGVGVAVLALSFSRTGRRIGSASGAGTRAVLERDRDEAGKVEGNEKRKEGG